MAGDVQKGDGRDSSPWKVHWHRDNGDGTYAEVHSANNRVWDTNALAWVKEQGIDGAISVSVSGGGGGPITVADGADAAQGTTTDNASASTLVGLLKAIKAAVQGTLAVSGPATDAQMRASAIPVSLATAPTTAVTGPLTDAQLRATRVPVDPSGVTSPVSLTALPTLAAGTNVIGHVIVDAAPSTAVTQSTSPWVTNDPGLPDTLGQKNMAGSTGIVLASDQSSIPVAATLTAETTKVIGTVNVSSGQTVGLAAGSQVIGHVIVDTAPTTAVTGPLTDTQLRATPVPVSGTVSANATLTAETTKVIGTVNVSSGQTVGLAAGSQVIGHVIVDTAPTTAVTIASMPSTPVTGPLTDTQLRATPVPVSGTVAATLTSQTVGIAAGTAVIGHVIVDTLPAVTGSVSVSNFPATQIVDGSAVTQPVTDSALATTNAHLAAMRDSLNEIAFASILTAEASLFV